MLCKLPVQTERYLIPSPVFYILLCLVALASNGSAVHAAESPLTLSDALSRAMTHNPQLQVFDLRAEGLQGRRIAADQNPAVEAGLEIENLLGSGERRNLDSAEYTLSLSSTLELGDRRQARVSAIDSRFGLLEAERRSKTLDLLGRVTQRFITTLALQHKLQLAADTVSLSRSVLETVNELADRAATPQADVLRARAALSQSQIEHARLSTQLEIHKMALTSLWGDTTIDFTQLQGSLFAFGDSDSFEALYQRISEHPAIQAYASEQRLRNAELQLARSQSAGDINWQVGVRRFEDSNEAAFTAGVSVPLFPAQRNRGAIQTALAARDEIEFRREDTSLRLHSRLFEAYQLRQQSVAAVDQIRSQLLPTLDDALVQTREAYETGRYSYVELMVAQQELLASQQALIDAATTALLNQALIEQLTAQPLAER